MTYRKLLLASTALAAFSGQAFAQGAIVTQSESGTPPFSQAISNSAIATGNALGTVTSIAVQTGNNELNSFTGTFVTAPWAVLQSVGAINTTATAPTLTGSVSQSVSNTIAAISTGALFANALAGGSQVAPTRRTRRPSALLRARAS